MKYNKTKEFQEDIKNCFSTLKMIVFSALVILISLSNSYSQIPQIFGNFPVTYDTTTVLSNPSWSEGLPVAADFRGDGGKEIAIGASDFGVGRPRMYLIDINGNTLPGWPRVFNIMGYPFYVLCTAAGDINHDGRIDLVLQTKDSIFAIDFHGNNLPGFPVYFPQHYAAAFGLAIYDLENSGELNIIALGDSNIVVLNHDGSYKTGWPRSITPPSIFRQLSVCDLNNDRKADIITTSFCSYGYG